MPYGKNEVPAAAKNLPKGAQAIFKAAFNAAYDKYGEERAFKIAWAAVKNKYKKEGDDWVVKDSEDAMPRRTEHVLLNDLATIDSATMRETPDGFLVFNARVARTGIQLYRGTDMDDSREVVRVYRPPETVMDKRAMASLTHRTITVEHPGEFVNSKNWKDVAGGMSGDEVVRDGEYVRVPMVLMDHDAIQAFRDGKREISVGYYSDIEWRDGVTASGERYDAIQSNIRANHIAIVARARGGPQLRLGDTEGDNPMPVERERLQKTVQLDGVDYTLFEPEASMLAREFNRMRDSVSTFDAANRKLTTDLATSQAALAAANTTIGTKDGEIAVLKQQVKDSALSPAALDKLTTERVALITSAKKVLGDSFKFDGIADLEIKRAVVAKRIGDQAKTMDAANVDGAYAAVIATAPTGTQQLADTFKRQVQVDAQGVRIEDASNDPAEQAWLERGKQQRDAWKGPVVGSA